MVFPSTEKKKLVQMMMTTAGLSPRCNFIRRCVPPSFIMNSLKKYFLMCAWNTEIKASDNDSRPMNTEPQMSVKLTLCWHHSIMYTCPTIFNEQATIIWSICDNCTAISYIMEDNGFVRSDIHVLFYTLARPSHGFFASVKK